MVLATIGWEVRNAIALAPLALLVLEELPDSLGAVKSRDWGLPTPAGAGSRPAMPAG